jgi:hypothetical protein
MAVFRMTLAECGALWSWLLSAAGLTAFTGLLHRDTLTCTGAWGVRAAGLGTTEAAAAEAGLGISCCSQSTSPTSTVFIQPK